MLLRIVLVLAACLSLAGCDASEPASNTTTVHRLKFVSFELPSSWALVEGRRDLYSPLGDEFEKLHIKIGAGRNPRFGPSKVRNRFIGIRNGLRENGQLVHADVSKHGHFEVFEWVRESKAPADEIIPEEFQHAGDRMLHQLNLIDDTDLSVSVRMLVEVQHYENYLPILRQLLQSIRPVGTGV